MKTERGWWAVASSRELGRAPLGLERFGERLVLFRDSSGAPRALDDRCPHRGASLALGKVKGDVIECPFHGFCFDAEGACTEIPAHGDALPIPEGMRTASHQVTEAHDLVWLWRGAGAPRGEPEWFEALEGLTHGEIVAEWATHYSRAIENQLDYTHLPFVHRTTIGRGMRPAIEVDRDVGPDHVRAFQAGSGERQWVEWRAPNVWANKLGRSTFVFLAFAPIDERRTRMYCRYYQGALRVPGLRHVFEWIVGRANRVILRQDQAVVESQRPYETHLGMDELLVPSDSPIAAYRRIRHRRLARELSLAS